nr:MAG TPA: hypothetical protein [Caudoviricetes sp.]
MPTDPPNLTTTSKLFRSMLLAYIFIGSGTKFATFGTLCKRFSIIFFTFEKKI